MLLKFPGHADAIVLYRQFIDAILHRVAGFLRKADEDLSSGPGEFHRITDYIEKNLMEAELIGNHILVFHILYIDTQAQIFFIHLILHHHTQILEKCRQMHRFFFQSHHAALNAAHIQYIIDQTEQVRTGGTDLGKIILHLFPIIYIRLCQICKSDYGIHGCTDIVRDAA